MVQLYSVPWRCVHTITGHLGIVYSIAISHDGKIFASSSHDKTIKIWNLNTRKELYTLKGHSKPVLSIDISPDGKTLASGSCDKTIKLWHLSTGEEICTLEEHLNEVFSIAISPDGKMLASGDDQGNITLWNLDSKHHIQTLNWYDFTVSFIAFSPDSQSLVSNSWSGQGESMVNEWNLSTGQSFRISDGYSSPAISPDGQTIAISTSDGEIKLSRLSTGEEIGTLTGNFNVENNLVFSPDGKILASGGTDWDDNDDDAEYYGTIELWNLETKQKICTLEGHLKGGVYAIAFTPDGQTIISGGVDSTIRIWHKLSEA